MCNSESSVSEKSRYIMMKPADKENGGGFSEYAPYAQKCCKGENVPDK